jgi:hypothetical protein
MSYDLTMVGVVMVRKTYFILTVFLICILCINVFSGAWAIVDNVDNGENANNNDDLENDPEDSEVEPKFIQADPSKYPPENVYYPYAYGLHKSENDLRGVPTWFPGSMVNLGKTELVNGRIYSFVYPGLWQRAAKLLSNPEFTGRPFISLVINTLDTPDKTFVATLGIDTNNDYDPHEPNTLEHRCEFPAYVTVLNRLVTPLSEEYYEAYGAWEGGEPPDTITSGRIILEVIMTSPNGEPALMYCGFNYKTSWLACKYMHNDRVPVAEINYTTKNQGFPPAQSIYAGTRIKFDGSDSYDPNDDLNGNRKIDGYETDRLKYQWSWGDGTYTGFDFGNKYSYHTYSNSHIPVKDEFKDFEVNLTVADKDGHMSWDTTRVRVFRGNHSPDIKVIKINNIEVYPNTERKIISVLSKKINVHFYAEATDSDDDELTYGWDFDGEPTTYEITGSEPDCSVVSYIFSEPFYAEGNHRITLVVSDGTLAENTSASFYITLMQNTEPVAEIAAKRYGDPKIYEGSIKVKLNQIITFYANRSYDPDNLMGFDLDNDTYIDAPLKYRWNFNNFNPYESTKWLFESFHEHSYSYYGRNIFWVTLDVDDGVNVTTSKPFEVRVNKKPQARIYIESDSFNALGNLEPQRPVILNASQSFDPNDDDIIDFVWKFLIGGQEILQYGRVVEQVFESTGVYPVVLRVYDGDIWSSEFYLKLEIPEPPRWNHVSYRAYPLDVFTGESVYFVASILSEPAFEKNKMTYYWDFDDGSDQVTNSNHTIHKYNLPGSFNVELTVYDPYDRNKTIRNTIITVKNRPPEARIHPISEKRAGWGVVLSGSESTDRDGRIVQYIWSFGDGSAEVRTNQSKIEHTWSKPGVYTVQLTVQDNFGSTANTFMTVVIQGEPKDEGGFDFIIPVLIIILFNIITITTLVKLIALLRARNFSKNKSKNKNGGNMG